MSWPIRFTARWLAMGGAVVLLGLILSEVAL